MIVFHLYLLRISGAVLLGLSILLIQSDFALADTNNVADYTDAQLLAAGWTAQQIADARDSMSDEEKIKKKPVQDTLGYVSVFDNYRSFEELDETEWLEANDNVGRIGGWRSYARQVQAEQKKESSNEDDK